MSNKKGRRQQVFSLDGNRCRTWNEDPYFTRRRWDYFVEHLMGEQPPRGYQVAAQ